MPISPQKLEAVRELENHVEENLRLLKPVDTCWQPADFLPDMASESWEGKIRALREASASLSDELFVVLVGDMITEEALPGYQTVLTAQEGLLGGLGAGETPFGKWIRGWTAEENRHGDLLNRYLYLTGRVDMRAVEITVQHLIRNGWDPKTARDPYKLFVYTSFQERATKISHGNVGRLALQAGEEILARICAIIAGDEARHETAYKTFFKRLLELDPEGALLAFAEMMKIKITMPAALMRDGRDENLFDSYSAVTQRLGVYTARDYAEILEHLIQFWSIADLTGLSGEAAGAQEYLVALPGRYVALAERFAERTRRRPKTTFRWIFNRSA